MSYKKVIAIFFLSFLSVFSQNAKYQKWLTPNYFRGYNILPVKTMQDVTDLKNYGGNLLQIGTFGFMAEDSPYDIQQTNIDNTDLLVSYCRATGVYYTIAVRSGPGAYDTYLESEGLTGESRIWNSGNTTEQQLYADMLKLIAERYAGDSLFAGLNLVVEPRPKVRYIPANTSENYKYFLENIFDIHMDEVYQFLIGEVRTADAMLPVIIENFAYSTPELFPSYALSDPYLIYDAHLYMPKEYTNAQTPYAASYPGTYWNITYLSQQYYDGTFMKKTILTRLRSFQKTVNKPVIIGEFGMFQPQYGSASYVYDVLDICKGYGWHFALWDWRRGQGYNWNFEAFYTPSTVTDTWRVVLSFFNTPAASSILNPPSKNSVKNVNPELFDNYPNPFNPTTKFRFSVPAGYTKVVVYDILGRLVKTLVDEQLGAGSYEVQFDGTNLPGGLYFFSLHTENFSQTKKMLLVK